MEITNLKTSFLRLVNHSIQAVNITKRADPFLIYSEAILLACLCYAQRLQLDCYFLSLLAINQEIEATNLGVVLFHRN